MKLPNNEVGISDILRYRECPQRFGFDMRRHNPMPERWALEPGEKDDSPFRQSYAASYGSAAHDCIEYVEQHECSDEEAIDAVWPRYQEWLEPGDADRLKVDLEVYRSRVSTGYRLIGTEIEMRAPLFTHEGVVIYFRGRIDVLYQHIDNGAIFLSRDYKSGRWPKSEQEVHEDVQQWAYNWLTHENYPECVTLVQQYDQLRFGSIPTRKSAQQRAQIKAWLIRQVKAILEDTTLKPKPNNWCYLCPLMLDCRVTHQAPDWWINRLAALAPEKKVGRKMVVQLTTEHGGFDIYTDILPRVKDARKVMERFEAAVEGVLKEMPDERRDELGYTLAKPRTLDVFGPDELRRIHAMMGDDFFQLASISKKALNEFYGEDSNEAKQILALAGKKQTSPPLKKAA
jgi:hypothetical protein